MKTNKGNTSDGMNRSIYLLMVLLIVINIGKAQTNPPAPRDLVKTMKLTIKGDSSVNKVLKDGSLVPADTYMSTIVVEPGDVAIYRWPKNI